MSDTGVSVRVTLGRGVIPATSEPQLAYVLVEAVPQGEITLQTQQRLSLCLVIDRSSSMRGERLSAVKEAAHRIVDMLDPQDNLALVVFNDRSDAIIALQPVRNRSHLKAIISNIEAEGGTEMANGLAAAAREMQRFREQAGQGRVIVLTDGRTYGDESLCIELTRRLQDRNIGLTAIGIGNDWNEDLLETMTARENSRTRYLASPADIVHTFTDEIKRMQSVCVQNVQITIETRPGAMIQSFNRVRPFIAPLTPIPENDTTWSAKLGDWSGHEANLFLIELVLPALPIGDHPALRLSLRYQAPGKGEQQSSHIVPLRVRPPEECDNEVNSLVKNWMERLTAYRLQARAWQDAAEGRIADATRRLQMAGTRLFEVGESELAQTLQDEATRLLRQGNTTSEGRKRIKYGTRGLIDVETP